jgi:hypothetical protein
MRFPCYFFIKLVKVNRNTSSEQLNANIYIVLTVLEFCYGVYNQYESFIYLNLMVKNREIPIERYFKWWTSTKLVWTRYQNY